MADPFELIRGLQNQLRELQKKVDLNGRIKDTQYFNLTPGDYDLRFRPTAHHLVYLCDTSALGFSVELPSLADAQGCILHFVKTSDSNVLTINPKTGTSDTILGNTSKTLNYNNSSIALFPGTQWFAL